jgi:hypothetical protein
MADMLTLLRQRKLGHWVFAYLAGAWLLYEVLSLVGQNFEWPKLVLQVITVLLGVGLLVVLVLAWYHGERGEQHVSGPELLILATLLLIAGLGVGFLVKPHEPVAPATVKGVAVEFPSPSPTSEDAIAVLPFVNMSADPEQEYFSDGITQELIDALANVEGLRVASRSSSFQFKGTAIDVSEAAHKLRVGKVVEGSVQKSGNRLRITA